jgi:hypothetical protein
LPLIIPYRFIVAGGVLLVIIILAIIWSQLP